MASETPWDEYALGLAVIGMLFVYWTLGRAVALRRLKANVPWVVSLFVGGFRRGFKDPGPPAQGHAQVMGILAALVQVVPLGTLAPWVPLSWPIRAESVAFLALEGLWLMYLSRRLIIDAPTGRPSADSPVK
jgi:hypothetical protein